jgi:hypothetical protein
VQASRWRDPRLVVGLVVVATCAVLGARLLAGADDTVGVWAARDSLLQGQPVTGAELVRRQVRFEDQADADRYVSADEPVPGGVVAAREVGSGELLPRGALGRPGLVASTEVPLSVDSAALPAGVRPGSTVDVWVTPDATPVTTAATAGRRPVRSLHVFHDVTVVSVAASRTSLGPSATEQVIVGVPPSASSGLPGSIAALASGDVLLTVRR